MQLHLRARAEGLKLEANCCAYALYMTATGDMPCSSHVNNCCGCSLLFATARRSSIDNQSNNTARPSAQRDLAGSCRGP